MEPIPSAGDVVITKSIARFGQASYQIANIGSVSLSTQTKVTDSVFDYPLGAVALLSLLGCFYNLALGLAGFILAFGALYYVCKTYHETTVTLKTSSGDI